jgi:soluble lytic murein transglycosylase-like protein
MVTSTDTTPCASNGSLARQFSRAILLAGLTLPWVLFSVNDPVDDRTAQAPNEAGGAEAAAAPDPEAGDQPFAALFRQVRYGLPEADIDRYRQIFAAADRGDWETVEALEGGVSDRRLIGHILAARYVSPDSGAGFPELRSWLDLYGDLPEAADIHRLAAARNPAGQSVALPAARGGESRIASEPGPGSIGSGEPKTSAAERAASRFFSADDKGALADSLRAIRVLGDRATTSRWIAGLAAWRLGDLAEAGRHFGALAASPTASGWMLAAGAYWSGRIEERTGGAETAAKWFAKASRYPTTFYGMLALRKLGVDLAQRISGAAMTADHLDALAQTPAGYRAMALLEIGRRDLAARELERVDAAGDPRLEEALIVVAQAAHLGDVSDILAERIAQPAQDASAHFPIPAWRPQGGFRVDPALVYAVARQESGFDPSALSPAGAVGLMQLMPGTAGKMAGPGPAGDMRQASLFDPSTNLELGQRYIRTLMQDPKIGENLLLLAVAYNGGNGNPAKFRQMLEHDDPLLAIESIARGETREFIEQVLANYWIYRARLGGDTASLSDLADGRWPTYHWDGGRPGLAQAGLAQARLTH